MPEFIDRTGEISTASNGMTIKIIKCRNNHDLDIQFEDGAVTEHKSYDAFLRGKVRHPGASSYTSWRVGEVRTANNGQKITILRYRDATDIDVQFEDGTVVEHKSYGAFKRGQVVNPNIQYANGATSNHDKVGETRVAKNGQQMTIIAYRRYADIDVQFEDGVIIRSIGYNAFRRGEVRNPGVYEVHRAARIQSILSKDYIMHNGLHLTVTAYNHSKSVNIRFETGFSRKDVSFDAVKDGMVKHDLPYQMDNIRIESPAYVYNGVGNFFCRCNKCGKRDIMSIQEIKNHICI